MRKLSLLSGAVLALLTATSAMAVAPQAAHQTTSVGTHASVVAHPAQKWTTAFTDGTVTVRGVLRASATYAGGSLTVRVAGVKRGEKLTIVLAKVDGTTTTPLVTRIVTIHTTQGHASVTRGLAKATLKALKALPAGATLTLTVTTTASTATGTFSGK